MAKCMNERTNGRKRTNAQKRAETGADQYSRQAAEQAARQAMEEKARVWAESAGDFVVSSELTHMQVYN
jgi:hypothetical protein